ncbi:MAG: OmpA family protein [Candidatus Kapabacteria bacterium]|nr:OmpA family protein [Candidatus Kapabacteria bacterium]
MRNRFTPTHHQDDAPHERYLITYADVITLLLCLFVILYATSQTDANKYRELVSAAGSVFSQNTAPQQAGGKNNPVGGENPLKSDGITADTSGNPANADSKGFAGRFSGLLRNGLTMEQRGDSSIALTLAEELLFDNGAAELNTLSYPSLDNLAAALKNGSYEIQVDGHTDCIPVRSFRYQSNWHLSVDRALAVGYYLMQQGVAEESIAIRGFGSQRPATDNTTPERRKRNRRVEVLIRMR